MYSIPVRIPFSAAAWRKLTPAQLAACPRFTRFVEDWQQANRTQAYEWTQLALRALVVPDARSLAELRQHPQGAKIDQVLHAHSADLSFVSKLLNLARRRQTFFANTAERFSFGESVTDWASYALDHGPIPFTPAQKAALREELGDLKAFLKGVAMVAVGEELARRDRDQPVAIVGPVKFMVGPTGFRSSLN
jgi:hypothetical protein